MICIRLIREWTLTFRVPVVLYLTISSSIVTLSIAYHFNKSVDLLSWLVASLVAWFTQGFITHVWNDIYDWLSGTDKLVDINKSIGGGSRVIHFFYRNDNVFKHLRNHIPWLAVCTIAVYYFGVVLGWWWYVLLGAIAAVIISVFYTAPPIQACYRPYIGEFVFMFGGLVLCNTFIYYAAAHTWPSVAPLLCVVLYTTGYLFGLGMHHMHDVYPDLHADRKKYTAISWLYERTKDTKAIVNKYFIPVSIIGVAVALMLCSMGIWQSLVFIPLYLYGVSWIANKYKYLDFDKYPEYLETTVPMEIKWMKAQVLIGLIFATLLAVLH